MTAHVQRQSGRYYARQLAPAQTIQQSLQTRTHAFSRGTGEGWISGKCHNMVTIKPRIHVIQVFERLSQKPRNHKQQRADCHLKSNKHVSSTPEPGRVNASASTLSEACTRLQRLQAPIRTALRSTQMRVSEKNNTRWFSARSREIGKRRVP